MATYKAFKENALSSVISSLECDLCGSHSIIENTGDYVCEDCGLVLEIQKLQYDRPYNADLIQYAKGLGRTQVGTKRERLVSPHSLRLQRLNKYNSIATSEKALSERAKLEINRLFGGLDIAEYTDVKEMVFDKFSKIRSEIRPGSKYRNVEKLVAVTIYFCLKLRNISINPYELIELAKISKKDFNDFIFQVRAYLPEYDNRNRQGYILQRVSEVVEHFDLGMPFYYLCKKVLFKLWKGIRGTTDDVVAGLVSSIAVLCTCKEKVSVSSLCNRLGIRMSTIQSQVKKNIFDRFKVEGFTSLVRSSDILAKIISKLGLIEPQRVELEQVQEVSSTDENVDIILGIVSEVFNAHNTFDYYMFAVRGVNRDPLIVTMRVNDNPFNLEDEEHSGIDCRPILEFKFRHYYRQKDPPLLRS